MSEYTPTDDQLRDIARNATGTGYYSGGVKALRSVWNAARTAEATEWEYGWTSWRNGQQNGESDRGNTREFAERAVELNREIFPGQSNAPDEYVLSKRTKAIPAGPWVPVKQEGAEADG